MGGCNSDNYLYPSDLYEVLKLAPQAKKTVVILACYSGGFINEQLKSLPNLTIITATSSNRVSYGSKRSDYSFFAEAFFDAWKNQSSSRNWANIFDQTKKEVEHMESARRIPRQKRSHPQFFQNNQSR